ncbi:MAG: hypothetical protein QM708_13145 [Propioniciclava sp.]|uniref:hypothetical protein n=1 Tax=Propioniciclava sp. TaxID=2038686 RepID=UPI0039E4CD95
MAQRDPVQKRRDFVAIATSTFSDSSNFGILEGIKDEVAALRDWLCDPSLGDRAFANTHPHFSNDPPLDEVIQSLGETDWSEAAAAVVFVSTHGWVHGKHWLAFHGTNKVKPSTTALGTSHLVEILRETDIKHLMLILDTCHAGRIGSDMSLPKDISWIILPSATEDEEAGVGVLSGAIAAFLKELRSPEGAQYGRGPYLTVGDFVQGIEKHIGEDQFAGALYPTAQSEPHPCLPNPHYKPSSAALSNPARRDLALLKEDLSTHWGPRARGVTGADEPGWLFSGRRTLMRRLIDFTQDGSGVLLVTGGAGSGKSAVLSRLVTLSDAAFRDDYAVEVAAVDPDLLPAEGVVDVAVLATGKNALEIFTQVCQAVGAIPAAATPSTIAEAKTSWDAWIAARTDPVTIVVDALDEATNPAEVVTGALQPLLAGSRMHPIRLLVGVRCTGGATPADTPRDGHNRQVVALLQATLGADPVQDRVQVDEAPWWDSGDVEEYVASILLGTEDSPYPDRPDAVDAVARRVTEGAGKSFLVAKLAANQLAARSVVDPDDTSWQDAIHRGVLGVFREDLHHTLPERHDRERAIHLLRAVAFSYGRGLPWGQIWPVVANAVADDDEIHYGNGDIAWLLSTRMGGYLVTDREDDVTVYRLFHDDLRTNLREHWRELLDGE